VAWYFNDRDEHGKSFQHKYQFGIKQSSLFLPGAADQPVIASVVAQEPKKRLDHFIECVNMGKHHLPVLILNIK
jgi:hypothetical protein